MQLIDMWSAEKFRKAIVRHLEHRFGELPQHTRDAINRVPDGFTEDLLIALLDFRDPSDADIWMAEHTQTC